jgi:hypothetical protein
MHLVFHGTQTQNLVNTQTDHTDWGAQALFVRIAIKTFPIAYVGRQIPRWNFYQMSQADAGSTASTTHWMGMQPSCRIVILA